ncbi:cation-translocating P-type ATPase [Lentisphaera profundi]|uniref:P-type Zn(2+) transporter n=1 Tax=Lentisphaera profundi TaxID=1658616 RepID=A0ABY7VVX7_9BACT|nr:cation-translocating P-type ATPase [Lentisphaera profundi]WDE98370.1 cation-translocating P-type ATPase [Lentisphaera profundi]
MRPLDNSQLFHDKHDHDHQEGSDCCGDGHSHAHVSGPVVMLGGALLLSSYIADSIFGEGSFHGQLTALVSALLLGIPIVKSAIIDVIKGRYFMNELVALALLAAFIGEDFRTAAAVAFFMLIAIAIEHRTAAGAHESIEEIIRLTPRKAKRLREDASEEEVDALDLALGDRIVVRPGDAFPADGELVKGSTSVNQASITGESLPVDCEVGAEIFAGTQNLSGLVHVKVTRIGSDTTLGKVRNLIEQAENAKLPVMRMIDRYTAYYLPTIMMIAAAVYFFSGFDMDRVVATLVVACPCALVVATPSALVASVAACARLGLLIKDVSVLELAAKVNSVVFDKTGTLTCGDLAVVKLKPREGIEPADLLKAAVVAESSSNHPAARAILRLASDAGVELPKDVECQEVPGRGVEARLGDQLIRVGRRSWLEESGVDCSAIIVNPEETKGRSVVYVADGEKVLGWIGLSDTLRKQAPIAINSLKKLGIEDLNMVTGDSDSVAVKVAKEVALNRVSSECLPHEKVEYVERLKSEGKIVAVVGDGVNDAPALAAGHVSIAMGVSGADIAVNSASVALMNNDLRRVPFFIKLAKTNASVMMQNLFIGLISIVGGLVLSTLGILDGVNAAIIHTISTLIIIANSARLVRQGENIEESETAEVS